MVTERRFLFEVSDLDRVTLTCVKCDHELSFKLTDDYQAKLDCPSCGERILSPTNDKPTALLIALRMLHHGQKQQLVRVRFEVREPEQERRSPA